MRVTARRDTRARALDANTANSVSQAAGSLILTAGLLFVAKDYLDNTAEAQDQDQDSIVCPRCEGRGLEVLEWSDGDTQEVICRTCGGTGRAVRRELTIPMGRDGQ
ncbi:unnamed protein product [Pedinophyceae sp. YPF-701]|nr:unnamed protein product [Pedinophyceae sp. YPF-701]